MNIRYPLVAGSFYEASSSSCRHHAVKLLETVELAPELPAKLFGGLVPHAGWTYSGAVAARTFKALASAGGLETVVLFGADHTGSVRKGEVFDSGVWRSPIGETAIDTELAEALLASADCLRSNPRAHEHEHSLEVQLPLLQAVAPSAKVVPIAVPPTDLAVRIGRAVGTTLARRFPRARVVGSTDLTHHGGHFPAPGGRGQAGEQWTTRNDRRMIDLIESLAEDEIIAEAEARQNACGAGAIAAAVAACKRMGATRGICLEYTNSYRVIHALFPDEPDDTTVGYASIVFA